MVLKISLVVFHLRLFWGEICFNKMGVSESRMHSLPFMV